MTALLLTLLAVQQAADTARQCRVVIDSVGGTSRQVEVAPPRPGSPAVYNFYAGGGVLAHCEGTRSNLTADSAAWYGQEGRLDLLGRVRIRDEGMHLDASTARYYTRTERLEAHRNVVAVNQRNGTVLRGPNLTYLRAVRGVRDTAEMTASSRPTIEYRSDPGGAEPYIIVADRVRMRGNDRIWAGGRVTVDRSDMAARADSMMMDQSAGKGVLLGRPRLEEKEWQLTGDTIHLVLREGKLHQTLAWGKSRPRAFSATHNVVGDSLAFDTPGEVLTELRAFGKALSTSKRDTTAAADVDWITGDTLVARFVQVPDTGGEQVGDGQVRGDGRTASGRGGGGGGTKSELREVIARGSARSLTHIYEDEARTEPPSINYSRGTSIAVTLKGDRLDRVLVAGGADGVHLEKVPPPPSPADTARAPSRP